MKFEQLQYGEAFSVYGEEILIKIPQITYENVVYTCVCVKSTDNLLRPTQPTEPLFKKGEAYWIYNTTSIIRIKSPVCAFAI